MKGLAGLKRGLGYFTSRSRTAEPDVTAVEATSDADAWRERLREASRGLALARHLARASLDVGGAASAVTTAIGRLERDHETHVRLITDLLMHLGADPTLTAEPEPPVGDPLERSVQLVLGALIVGMSRKSSAGAQARGEADPHEAALIDLVTRDQLAHADLGFLLWPLVRHTWEQEKGGDVDAFALKILNDELPNLPEAVRKRLSRRLNSVGLEVVAAA